MYNFVKNRRNKNGFFDDISKKLSQTGQGMVQKTKEMADVAKLNSAITDEEGKINNNYYLIGKLYVSMHMADCENCGNEINENQKFCPKCGTPVSKPSENITALNKTEVQAQPVIIKKDTAQ